MNLCTFVGRITKDPEIRYAQESQMPVAKFVLAVDRNYKGAEGEESADFFPCVAFDKKAEFAENYLYKGIRIAIHGKMRNNNYTNRNGEKVYGNSLYVDNIEFADGKREEGKELPAQPGGRTSKEGSSQKTGQSAGGSGQWGRGGNAQAAEKGKSAGRTARGKGNRAASPRGDGFLDIPDGIEDEDLPFN